MRSTMKTFATEARLSATCPLPDSDQRTKCAPDDRLPRSNRSCHSGAMPTGSAYGRPDDKLRIEPGIQGFPDVQSAHLRSDAIAPSRNDGDGIASSLRSSQ